MLSMVKVPSDPAQVIVNHASFRVQLGATSARALDRTARTPVIPSSVRPGRRTPVAWSGRSAPDDQAATQLLQAMRSGGEADTGMSSTQVLSRIDEETQPAPVLVGQRRSGGSYPGEMLGGVRPARGAFDEDPYDDPYGEKPYGGGPEEEPPAREGSRGRAEAVRYAYYPGRRMNLGIVLLPLRIFLGFISICAGMGKLCDPVHFDGGKRGSMVTWLDSLHPWAAAEPLRDLALSHPVGAGLTVAFLQIIAGVLTVFGLWQRLAASVGVLLSAALLVTVSWRTMPVYDAPDIIYLAAWSPLVIAGAPVYSVDGRLAGEAWRRLGPRAPLWELRRRVLRRGTVLATVIMGLTLVVGSTLGAAVRSTSTRTDVPRPSELPINNQQGSPLPQVSGEGSPSAGASAPPAGQLSEPSATASPSSASSSSSVAPVPTRRSDGSAATGGDNSPQQPTSGPDTPSRSSAGSTEPAPDPSSGSDSSDSGGALGGLLGSGETSGWLLGKHDGSGGGRTAPSGSA